MAKKAKTDQPAERPALGRTLAELYAHWKTAKPVSFTPFRLPSLDTRIRGVPEGTVLVVGARTRHGKTSFLLDYALRNAVKGVQGCFVSLEMTDLFIFYRLLSKWTGISEQKIAAKELTPEEWELVETAAAELTTLPLLILFKPGLTSGQYVKLNQELAEQGFAFVCLDYIGKLRADEETESRRVEVSQAAKAVEYAGQITGVTQVAAAQLNREAEKREGMPKISDLEDSGTIEQIAWQIILIQLNFETEEADLSIAKNRSGQTGEVTLRFLGESTTFCEWEGR